MKLLFVFLFVFLMSLNSAFANNRLDLISGSPQSVPVKGVVTMVDIGAKACIPCKMMIPVIESLSKELDGKAAIVFIDVWKNPKEGDIFGIRTIPTQIFYDKDGFEVYRHEGYFDKDSILTVLNDLGVK